MKQLKPIFSPSDFYSYGASNSNNPEYLANLCNEKLEKLIDSWPVVMSSNENAWWYRADETIKFSAYPTHQARLAFIEPIKRDCKHEPKETSFMSLDLRCKHCGVPLEATWREKGRL